MPAASHTNVFTGIFPVSHLNILANPGCKAKAAKNSKIRMNGGESNSLSDKIEDKISVCGDRNVKLSVIERMSSENHRSVSSLVRPTKR